MAAVRYYTPPEDLKKLYASDFDNQAYPVNVVGSDATLFAKFLYKAVEEKKGFDSILKDFDTIASAKLPIFWERASNLDTMAEFKTLSPPTTFVLNWMQQNAMLDQISVVRATFETYVNALRKKAVARIYVGDEKNAAAIAEGKKVAAELLKGTKELEGFTLETVTVVDSTFVSGFSVELAGQFVNQGQGAQVANAVKKDDDVDYTNAPAAKVCKTVWEDSVETEVLRKYIEQLAQFDAEEAKIGV
jgi:hypothetical protein